MIFRRGRCIIPLLLAWLASWPAAADFAELEHLFESPAATLAERLKGKQVVVAVRNGAASATPWNLGEAAGVELTEALRRLQIDAIRAAADARLRDLESIDRPFTGQQAQSLKRIGRDVLVGIELLDAEPSRVKVVAFSSRSPKALWAAVIDVPAAARSLENNLPAMNRAAVEFARKNLGQMVREGDCTHLAEDCLKAAGTGKRGVYRWGRELGAREPWLPGDILQLERAQVTAPGFVRGFAHHTAVVDRAGPDEIVVLHQNVSQTGRP